MSGRVAHRMAHMTSAKSLMLKGPGSSMVLHVQ